MDYKQDECECDVVWTIDQGTGRARPKVKYCKLHDGMNTMIEGLEEVWGLAHSMLTGVLTMDEGLGLIIGKCRYAFEVVGHSYDPQEMEDEDVGTE